MTEGPEQGGFGPARRLLPVWVFLLLVALRLPVVTTPFFEDDLHQLVYLSGAESHPFAFRGSLDLFRFFDGDSAAADARVESGGLPWRTETTQRVAFLRPIPSALMWLDYTLFGLASRPAHVHSLLWFIAFALSAAALYRRLLPPGAATIALLACLMAPTSLQAIRWWSARNALIAAVFAAWCLSLYVSWWRSGRGSRLGGSLLCLAAALLSAESALAVIAFPLAHALVPGRERLKRALAGVGALVATGVAFLALRGALGYGIAGNALYLNPLVEPLAYVETALPRIGTALGIVFLNGTAEGLWLVVPLLLVFATLIVSRIRAGGERAQTILWLTLGSLLALAVCFASRSSLRPWTMLVPQLGAHAVLGLVLANTWQAERHSRRESTTYRLLATLAAVACMVAPLYRHWKIAEVSFRTASAEERAAEFPAETRQAIHPETRRLVLIDSPYQVRTADYLRLIHGVELAPGTRVLTMNDNPFSGGARTLERNGPASLELAGEATLVRRNDLFRYDDLEPLSTGWEVESGGYRLTLLEAPKGVVRRLGLSLDVDVDDPSLVLLRWDGKAFQVVERLDTGASISWP